MSGIPKSLVNPLDDLYALIDKGRITKTINYQGKNYTFRSLCDEDYTWRDQFVNSNGIVVMMSSQRSPTLAVATVAVDGVPVEQIPGMDEVGEGIPLSVREFVASSAKYLLAYNLHTKVYSQLPREYIEGLHDQYLNEIERPASVVSEKDVKNS